MGFTLAGPEDRLLTQLQQHAGLEFSARAIGRYDIIATMSFVSLASSSAAFESLQRIPEVLALDTWLHVKVHLERYRRSARFPSPTG